MGAGGQQTSTTHTNLPPGVEAAANRYLNSLLQYTLQPGSFNVVQSPQPYQETAPMTPQQLQAMRLTSQETYGPAGAPGGGGGAPNANALMQGMMASPYWQQQLAANPYIQQAFSQPALGQLAQLYMGGGA